MSLEFEPALPGRHAAMLAALIQPRWSKDPAAWRLELAEWERTIDRYETQSGQSFASALRLAVVAQHGPAAVQEVIRQNSQHIGDDYAMMKRTVLEHIDSTRGWNADAFREMPNTSGAGGQQDMDIDAVYGGWDKGDKGGKRKDKST